MKEASKRFDAVDSEGKPARVEIGRYPSAGRAHDAGLAVLSAGRPYWVYPDQDAFVLLVKGRDAEWLAGEVEAVEARNRSWPPSRLELPLQPANALSAMGVAFLLGGVFYLQSLDPDMTEQGMNSSRAVLADGEWWRLVTAVTLHADIAHLAGNLAGLPLFGYLCCRYLGSGIAWLAILLVAALANLTNVLLWGSDAFQSLGASTAVFASLGLLAGVPVGWYLRLGKPVRRHEWLVPLTGASILFFWLGGGEYPTDIAGHLWAFLLGVGAAIPLAYRLVGPRVRTRLQQLLLAATAVLMGGCWILASMGS